MFPSLQAFTGRWRLSRRITDHRAGGTGLFTGHARFTPDGQGLRYEETGTLELNGARFHASRHYLWRAQGVGIDVFFDDGRFFHHIAPDHPEATHDCAPDLYRVRYDFATWPEWSSRWEVSGPRKAYLAENQFVRDDARG